MKRLQPIKAGINDESVEIVLLLQGEVDHLPAFVGVGVDKFLVDSFSGKVFRIGILFGGMQLGRYGDFPSRAERVGETQLIADLLVLFPVVGPWVNPGGTEVILAKKGGVI